MKIICIYTYSKMFDRLLSSQYFSLFCVGGCVICGRRILRKPLMKPKSFVPYVFLLFVALAWVPSVMGADIPRITKEELKAMIGNPNVIIVDVRTNAGWSESKLKIKGAIREDPTQVKSWIEKYPLDKTFVFYCS